MENNPLVLIVEDSPTQAKWYVASLHNHMRTMVATNGLEGLRTAVEQRPDLILLDINLPGMDGLQICRRLKRDKEMAHIPIVLLTSSESTETQKLGMEAGADAFIRKSAWVSESLLATVRNLLHV